MKVRKIPMRTCIVTGEKLEKKDLIRIVRTPEGDVVVDLSGKINGRGAYIKKSLDVLEKCEDKKILDKKLGIRVGEDVYLEIRKIIEN